MTSSPNTFIQRLVEEADGLVDQMSDTFGKRLFHEQDGQFFINSEAVAIVVQAAALANLAAGGKDQSSLKIAYLLQGLVSRSRGSRLEDRV